MLCSRLPLHFAGPRAAHSQHRAEDEHAGPGRRRRVLLETDAAAIAAEDTSLDIDEGATAVVDVGVEDASEDDGTAAAAVAEEGAAAAVAEAVTAAAAAAEAWTSHLDPSSDLVY